MLHDRTPGLGARLATGRPISGYNGFDPSGPSLHAGHLVPVFGLLHLQRHGGRPVALIGGATGMIGDPSGASAERNLLDRDTIAANAAAIRAQLGRFVDFSAGSRGALMVNNLDWLGPLTTLDFLREVGKHFTVPYMLGKESVQQRLERGLSFTEFSYMLLQSADFLHLYRTLGVEMQMGGADQWGNITAGLELIRKVEGVGEGGESPAHAIAYPLLTDPSGAKFGKTAAGTSVWLDPALTSPFAFYQFWLNTEDAVVGRLLRYFTLFSRDEIEALEAEGAARPEARPGQRALARDITARVHGEGEADNARVASEAIFGGSVARLSPAQKSFVAQVIERASPIPRTSFATGLSAAQIALSSNTVTSMSEARRLILQGGLYINDERITDADELVPEPDDGRLFIRVGKRRYVLVPVED